jgi:hypothetical protein
VRADIQGTVQSDLAIDPPCPERIVLSARRQCVMERKTMMRDIRRFCVSLLAGVVGYLLHGQEARAKLPPSAYAKMQNEADEFVQIEVLQVQGEARRGINQESRFTLTAKIVCTARSRAGLKPGAIITIVYATVLARPSGWVGQRRLSQRIGWHLHAGRPRPQFHRGQPAGPRAPRHGKAVLIDGLAHHAQKWGPFCA